MVSLLRPLAIPSTNPYEIIFFNNVKSVFYKN
jgi:hypothetical protein